jgi:hypothetical protein
LISGDSHSINTIATPDAAVCLDDTLPPDPEYTYYWQSKGHTTDATPTFLSSINAELQDTFHPLAFTLIPYKLNVYGPGGFFRSHIDSPTIDPAKMFVRWLLRCHRNSMEALYTSPHRPEAVQRQTNCL